MQKTSLSCFLTSLLILTLWLLTCSSAYAAETAENDGYYITKQGDTMRGKIQIRMKRLKDQPTKALFGGMVKGPFPDPLEEDVPHESKKIDFSNLTFEFKFSENGEKFKKSIG